VEKWPVNEFVVLMDRKWLPLLPVGPAVSCCLCDGVWIGSGRRCYLSVLQCLAVSVTVYGSEVVTVINCRSCSVLLSL